MSQKAKHFSMTAYPRETVCEFRFLRLGGLLPDRVERASVAGWVDKVLIRDVPTSRQDGSRERFVTVGERVFAADLGATASYHDLRHENR